LPAVADPDGDRVEPPLVYVPRRPATPRYLVAAVGRDPPEAIIDIQKSCLASPRRQSRPRR